MQTTINLNETSLSRLITHHIGNKSQEGQLILREEETQVADDDTEKYLSSYFLDTLKTEEVFELTHTIDLQHNPVYTLAKDLLNDRSRFTEISKKLGQLLFESSTHPRIKEGKLSIAIFEQVHYDDEVCTAIGIFKSETSVPFLQIHEMESNYAFSHDFGFELKGLDKACLIIDRNQENGFSLLIRDHASKQLEAQYWTEDFLGVRHHQSSDSFPISQRAVKSQSNVYKSVLKLDKNFSVYIHGDKSMIERGMEPNGRKFYKLYYENES